MDRSIYDNVALPMRIESISENEIKRRVSAALDKTGLLDKARCLPSQLSGGEQQRVGIARAVVNRPTLLLADEPTATLILSFPAEYCVCLKSSIALGSQYCWRRTIFIW